MKLGSNHRVNPASLSALLNEMAFRRERTGRGPRAARAVSSNPTQCVGL